jgi:hypothetical protein
MASRLAVVAGLLLVAAVARTSAVEILKSQEQLDEMIAEVGGRAYPYALYIALFHASPKPCSPKCQHPFRACFLFVRRATRSTATPTPTPPCTA